MFCYSYFAECIFKNNKIIIIIPRIKFQRLNSTGLQLSQIYWAVETSLYIGNWAFYKVAFIPRIVCIINLLMVSKKILQDLAIYLNYVWMCVLVSYACYVSIVILVNESTCNKKNVFVGWFGGSWLWVSSRGYGSWVWCWPFWVVTAKIGQITGCEQMEF